MKSQLRLSALVITGNEEANIERCLDSLRFCDEIVVLDSESTDRTVEVARRRTERVFIEPWRGYSAQKQRGLELTRGEWILWIDADEVASPELAVSIRRALDAEQDGVTGYEVRRQVCYLGRWIRHGGWQADWTLRLFRKDSARFSDDRVHERVLLTGRSGRIDGRLEHHTYRSLAHHWTRILELSTLWAEQSRAKGRRACFWDLLFRPPLRFLKIYVIRLGFLDGWRGLVIAGLASAYVLLKYGRLMEEQR
jgi:glycosyltransferase involved in cell wall biosynthesis